MIILLAILAATRAYPVGLQSSPALSLDYVQSPSCNDPNDYRSLWDIIRSCALTIFLCSWVSVHPNIPSPDEGWPRVTLRRMGLMLATLVVPEAIIAWAVRQRLAARKLAKDHKGEGWTLTHGFFAIMGGFMKYEGNKPIEVLLPHELRSYSLTGNGDFPRISKMEIQDKSKGDFILKTVVILQTSWFVIQCIARGVQGLPITELELATVAFTALNLVIYVLWWDKPLNVECGVRVYKKRTDSRVDDGHVLARAGFWVALGDALSRVPAAIVDDSEAEYMVFDWEDWRWPARVLTWPFIKPLNILAGGYQDRVGKRVTTFYPHDWYGHHTNMRPAAMFIAGIASVFGLIHSIGLSFTFPSSIEKTLWCVASMSITFVPIALFLAGLLVDLVDRDLLLTLRSSYRVYSYPNRHGHSTWMLRSYFGLQLLLYVSSRLVLLTLPFLSLRSLPPEIYYTVHWTSFIPHI